MLCIVMLMGGASLASASFFPGIPDIFGFNVGTQEHHTVWLFSPPDDSYTNKDNDSLQFVFNHTGELTGTVNCTLFLDGAAVNYTANVSADTDTSVYSNTTISETIHNWWVNCINGTDAESSLDVGHNYTFTADYTDPTEPALISPANNTNSSDNTPDLNWTTVIEDNFANYTVQADDDSAFGSVDYTCNTTTITESNYSLTSGWSDGKWYWKVIAYDLLGNSNTSGYFIYTVDTDPPTVQFVLLTTESGSYLQDYIDANVTASDFDAMTVYLYNATGLVQSNVSFSSPLSVNFTDLSDGTYYLNATANDSVGNLNSTETRTIILDHLAPSLSGLSYDSNVDVDDGSTMIRVNASDTLAGVDKVVIEENSSGAFVNHTMNLELGDLYSGIYNYSLSYSSLGEVSFKIYANDTLGHLENTSSYTIYVQNISVSINLDKTTVNPEENITVSGKAVLQPDGVNVTGNNISIWINNIFQINCTIDSHGDYSCNVTLPLESGTNIVKVNLIDANGIYGENQTNFTSRIAIKNQKATSPQTQTSYVSPNQQINISALIYKNLDNPIDNVWVNITLPDSIVNTYYLDNTTAPNETQTWYKVLNVTQDFGNLLGQYNVTFYANSTLTNGSAITQEIPAPATDFYIQNISVSINLDKIVSNPEENITVSGKAVLQPGGTNAMNNSISIWLDGNLLKIGELLTNKLTSIGWEYRKAITISNTAEDLTDFQVLIHVNLSQEYAINKIQQYCNDTRFTYYNSTSGQETEIPYWIETCNLFSLDNASFWVKIPFLENAVDTMLYMYYSNPSASSMSNGTNTFILWDDFEIGDLAGWSTSGPFTITTSDNTPDSSNYAAYIIIRDESSSTPGELYQNLILPSDTSLYLHFWMKVGCLAWCAWHEGGRAFIDNGTFSTIYSTGGGGGSGTTYLWAEHNIDISNWLGQTVDLGFYGINTVTGCDHDCDIYVDDVHIRKYASPEPIASVSTEQALISTDSLGNYNYTFQAPLEAGTHTVKINLTDLNGIYGENQTSFTTRIAIRNQKAIFEETGTNYHDADENPNINISALVYRNRDNPIDNVWINITLLNTTVRTYFLDNTTFPNDTQTWYKILNVTQEFDNLMGQYNVTFYANSTLSNGSAITQEIPAPTANFYIQSISISVNLDNYIVNSEENITVSGKAILEPDGMNVTNNPISIWFDGNLATMLNAGGYVPVLNGTWKYRKPISISNTGGNLTDYQVKIVQNLSTEYQNNKIQQYCNDTRFTYYSSTSAAETEIPYWAEICNLSNSGNATFWVKCPYLENNTDTRIYMYYGNPNTSSASNRTSSYILWEDFEDSSWSDSLELLYEDAGCSGSNDYHFESIVSEETEMLKVRLKCADRDYFTTKTNFSGPASLNFSYKQNIDPTDCGGGLGGYYNVQYYNGTWQNIATLGTRGSNSGYTIVSYMINSNYENIKIRWQMFDKCNSLDDSYFWLDDVYMRKYISPEPIATTGAEQSVTSIDSNGNYNYTFQAPLEAGIRTLKVNLTDSNGIYGENQTNFTQQIIAIIEQKAIFEESGTNYHDVNKNPDINISAFVYRNIDDKIGNVWVNITMPNTTVRTYFLDNVTLKNETQTWYKVLNVTQEFSNLLGQYNVTFYANSTLSNGSSITQEIPAPTANFYMQNTQVSINLDKSVYDPEENVTVFGKSLLQPGGTNVTENTIHIYLDGTELLYNATTGLISPEGNETLSTDSNGDYDYTFQILEAGIRILKVNLTDLNGIYGENQTNFTSRIAIRNQKAIFEESGTSYLDANDISINPNINILAFVHRNIDDEMGNVWVNIAMPNTTVRTYFLDNTTLKNETQTWYKVLNVTQEFGNLIGQYNVTFYANSTLTNGSTIMQEIPAPATIFYIQNIAVSINLDKTVANPEENITVSGKAVLEPDGANATNNTIYIWLNGNLLALPNYIPALGGYWKHLRPISIQNTAGGLTDYPIKIVQNFSTEYANNKIQQYCHDLRFTSYNSTSGQEIESPYWIEECDMSNLGNVTFWIKVPFLEGGTNTTIYVYYGNSKASSASNGTNVFEFFDDFEDGVIDTDKWEVTGNPTESDGILSADSSNYVKGKNAYLYYAIRSRAKFSGIANTGFTRGFGFYNPSVNDAITLVLKNGGQLTLWTENDGGGHIGSFGTGDIGFYRVWDITWISGKAEVYADSSLRKSHTSSIPNEVCYPYIKMGAVGNTIDADWILINKYASSEPTTTTGPEQLVASTDSNGNYNYVFEAPQEAGTHTLKVNLTNPNGIYGENQTNFTSRIAIRNQKAIFEESWINYLDADDVAINPNINISALVYRNIDNEIDNVWVNITMPNTTVGIYFLDNTTSPNETQTWYKILNATQEFGNLMGQYNVTFYANSTLSNGSAIIQEIPAPTTNFYIQNISVSINLDKPVYNLGENITVSGKAVLQPGGVNVTNNSILIWLDENSLKIGELLTNKLTSIGWKYRKAITISNTAEDLTDFQVLIHVNLSQEYAINKIQQYCNDIKFTYYNLTSEQETEIPYWIETCNLSNSGNATFWVKVPFLENNTNTIIYIYYGNINVNSIGKMWDNIKHLNISGGVFNYNASMGINSYHSRDMQHRSGVAAGFYHNCVLKPDRNVDCYGRNHYGQSNDYTGGDAIGVSAGEGHTCILKSDGNVDCYGRNDYSQSNDYTGSDAIAVSVGVFHTCILKSDRNVDCYGHNDYGQSNDYTGGDAIGVSVGTYYTCVLTSDGNIDCYGENDYGQSNDYTGGDAIGISVGRFHTCVLKSNGNVDCYGYNDYGQSNDYTGGDAIGISAGQWYTCVLKSDGNVDCYGVNNYGQSNDYTGADAIGVSAGTGHTCVLKSDGNIDCYGDNYYGQSNDYTGGDAKNPFRKYTSLAPYISSIEKERLVISTDSNGNYNYTLQAPLEAGNHTIKINLTDANGIYGENSTTFVQQRIAIRNRKAIFVEFGTNYLNVDEIHINPNINVSALVYKNIDNPIDNVWVNITLPDSTIKTYYLDNTTLKSETQTWYKILNVTQEFNNLLGNYTVTFYANSTLTNGSVIIKEIPAPTTNFYIQNILVSIDLEKTIVYEDGEPLVTGTVFGKTVLQPDETNVTNNSIVLWLDGVLSDGIIDHGFESGEFYGWKNGSNAELSSESYLGNYSMLLSPYGPNHDVTYIEYAYQDVFIDKNYLKFYLKTQRTGSDDSVGDRQCEVYINNTDMFSLSGNNNWSQHVIDISQFKGTFQTVILRSYFYCYSCTTRGINCSFDDVYFSDANGNFVTTTTDSKGNYNYTFKAPLDSGTYTVKVNLSNENGIYGENETILYQPGCQPAINIIQCENGTDWVNCSEILYGSNLTAVRANCTDGNGYIIDAIFNLTNTPDSSTFFHTNAIYNTSDWWVYNTSGIIIEDSGEFVLKVMCTDNDSVSVINSTNWTVPGGHLEPYLITQSKSVSQNEFFTFSAGVNCIGGECGNISALLDPLSAAEDDYFYNIMANLANTDSQGTACHPVAGTDYSCESQKHQDWSISAYAKAYLSAKINNDYQNALKYYNIMINMANSDTESGSGGECYPVAGNDYSCYCSFGQGATIEGYADAYFAASKAGDAANASRFLDIMNNMANTDPQSRCTPVTGGDYDCVDGGWTIRQSVIISGYARAYEAASLAGDMQNAYKYLNIMNNLANTLDYLGYSERPGCYACAIKAFADAYIAAVEAGDNDNASYYLTVMHNISKTDPSESCAPASGTDYSCNDSGDGSSKKQGLMILAYARAYEAANLAGDEENASLYLNITRNLANTTASDDATCKPLEGTYSCSDRPGRQEYLVWGYAQMQLMEGIDIKGTVPTTVGEKPFYTINNNPQTCLNMKGEDTCELSWSVNATGDAETIWLFYTIFNPTTYSSYIQGNQTDIVNITINLDTTPPSYCGDGICSNGETCSSCPSDCGFCSGGGNHQYILQDDQGEDGNNETDEDDEISDLIDDESNQILQQDDEDKIEVNETVALEHIEDVEALLFELGGKGHKVIDEAAEMIALARQALEDGSYEDAYSLARNAENMLLEQDARIAGDDAATGDAGLSPAAYALLLIALLILGAYMLLKKRDVAKAAPDDGLDKAVEAVPAAGKVDENAKSGELKSIPPAQSEGVHEAVKESEEKLGTQIDKIIKKIDEISKRLNKKR